MKTFEELDLISPVRRALAAVNYEIPTPIQAQVIPKALAGQDVIGLAQTGSGKTGLCIDLLEEAPRVVREGLGAVEDFV